jgi:tetratricopeptide (TPR) repeat protein
MVYTRTLGAARSGDAPAVRKGIEKLQSLHQAMIEAKISYWPQQADIQIKIASAWAAFAEGNKQEALKLMREGADMEDASEKHPVTPGQVAPARELLGDMLLELKQPALALKEYEASHKKEPGRYRGLLGAARAAELSGDKAKAKGYYADLLRLTEKSDGERPELAQAKKFLAKK